MGTRVVGQTINLQQEVGAEESKYITQIDSYGIRIHPAAETSNTTSIQLDGTGLDIKKGGISVAKYGENIIIGNESLNNITINSNGINIRNRLSELAKFSTSGIQIGANNDYHGVFASSALEFYDALGNKQMVLTDNAANYYKDGVFRCSIGEKNGFYGIRLGGTNYTPERGDNSFECIGQLTEDDYGYYSMGKVRAESGGEYMLQKEYSRASLALEAYAAYGNKYNYLRLQAYTSGWSGIEASVAITVNSDERLKENFKTTDVVSDLILDIKPVIYSWKDGRTNQRHIGFKAQDVQMALSNYVENANDYALVSKSSDEYLNLSYTELIPLIVDQLQKQNKEINELKQQIKELEKK